MSPARPLRAVVEPPKTLPLWTIPQQVARMGKLGSGTAVLLRLEEHERTQASMGTEAAELHIRAVYRTLGEAARPGDDIARVGSGRFLVLAHGLQSPRAVQGLVRRLLRSCDEVQLDDDQVTHHALTAGVAFFGDETPASEEVLRRAEVGLHQAAASGRQVCFYDARLDEEIAETMRLTSELVEALGGEELHLVYQPQVCGVTGQIVGVEGLMRWTSRTRGPVSPGVFVPMAERAGLAVRLTETAVRQAARQAKAWAAIAPPGFRISVNLSGAELADPMRAQQLLQLVAEEGGDPRHLTFEVTESTLMRSREVAIQVMEELRLAGAHLAIDDFGTGYSSLAYLADLPVHYVKIDRKFVKDLHRAPVRSLLNSMVAMIHALGLSVVVEGVETAEQLAMSREASVEVIQGYLTGRPSPPGDIEAQMGRSPRHAVTPGPAERAVPNDTPPLLPTLPLALHRLRRARGAALLALVRSDPCLALSALQLAHTAGTPRAPGTLRQALEAGAAERLQAALVGAPTHRVFVPDEGTERLWVQSVAVAAWTEQLALACPELGVSPDVGYTAGLVHDMGRFVLLATHPGQATAVDRAALATGADLLELERRTLAADHTTIGALECRARGIHPGLRSAVEHHHAASLTEVPERRRPLVSLVRAADRLATLQRRRADLATADPRDRRMALTAAVESLPEPLRIAPTALESAWHPVQDTLAERLALIGLS
jgi:EAL domain-containing protein (putative c-di-GMP-specific phosphodiesterase class I)/GGDEF domain-containing protein